MKFRLALILASSLTSFSALSFENVRIDFKDAAGTARIKHAGNADVRPDLVKVRAQRETFIPPLTACCTSAFGFICVKRNYV